ncbi:MAG: T9SS type A sorting domain-containing protein [Ignavibacteria bacterium]|nr:T9SS type A sorting domain-containing protein [Ignavibacteria bacterium]
MNALKYFILLLLLFPLTGKSQWQLVSIGNNENLYSIYFTSYNTGYIGGFQGRIFKTTNAGQNWQLLYNNQSLSGIIDVEFVNESTGFAASFGSYILKTTNAGENWQSQNLTFGSTFLTSINFINHNTGFLSSWSTMLIKTTDCGNTWSINSSHYADLECVQFLNEMTGYVGGRMWGSPSQGYLAKTTNGGNNWYRWIFLPASGFNSMSFINAQTGFVCSDFGTLFKTTNGGYNNGWNIVYLGADNVQAIDSIFVYTSGGSGHIRKSTDGGINWVTMITPTTENINDLHFLNKDSGYACGANGVVIRINNASTIGIKTINNEIPLSVKLFQNYPNPFNPNTSIKFDIPKSSYVKLIVYDILGKEIATLVNEKLGAGSYETNWDGSNYPSGVYFYRLQAGDFVDVKKMVILK